MVKDIVKNKEFLTQKSERFTRNFAVIQDLIDTANAHSDNCLGLAAVQIGYLEEVIVVKINGKYVPFINPVIAYRSPDTYIATESCLSVDGQRDVKRHKSIKVGYTSASGKRKFEFYNGLTAEIIQHECDHLNGILI